MLCFVVYTCIRARKSINLCGRIGIKCVTCIRNGLNWSAVLFLNLTNSLFLVIFLTLLTIISLLSIETQVNQLKLLAMKCRVLGRPSFLKQYITLLKMLHTFIVNWEIEVNRIMLRNRGLLNAELMYFVNLRNYFY